MEELKKQTPDKIAVYGTLRRGGSANGFLKGLNYVRQDTVKASLFDLGWYPGIKFDIDDSEVVVDVYELPTDDKELDRVLVNVDRYEGYDPKDPDRSLFKRIETDLLKSKDKVFIYEYCYDVDNRRLIESGDWINGKNN